MYRVPKLVLPLTTDQYILSAKVILKTLKKQLYTSNKEIETLDKMISVLQTSNKFSCREISILIKQRDTLKLFNKSIKRNMKEMGDEVQRMRVNNQKRFYIWINLHKKVKDSIISGVPSNIVMTKDVIHSYKCMFEEKTYQLTCYREKHGLDIFGYDYSEFNKGKRK